MSGITNETVATLVRSIAREVVLEIRALDAQANGTTAAEPHPELAQHDVRGYARYVLEEAGEPMHVRAMAKRMRELGYKPKRPPADPNQTESTLNSLAAPSRYPDEFGRAGGRTLMLKR